jgi:hypothetical protein
VELREGATADLRWGNGDRAPCRGRGKGRRGGDPWGAAAGSGAAGFRGGVVAESGGSPLGKRLRGSLSGTRQRSGVHGDPWEAAAGSEAAVRSGAAGLCG